MIFFSQTLDKKIKKQFNKYWFIRFILNILIALIINIFDLK